MKILGLEIRNFRGLSDVHFDFERGANVIVGPNAVGKTTILEAIRLVLAVLVPRYPQETQQVLVALGALSPQFQIMQQPIDASALARDPSIPPVIGLNLELSSTDMSILQAQKDAIAMDNLRGRMGRPDDQLALTQFLSSPQGKGSLAQSSTEIADRLNAIGSPARFSLQLTIDPSKNQITGNDAVLQSFVAVLERTQPINKALFSYFPADRAFPSGEVAVQMGSGEAAAQIQAHLGNASTKYQRLKQTVVNSMIFSHGEQAKIEEDFNRILSVFLPGKHLAGIAPTPLGALRVGIREDVKGVPGGKTFDIDQLSSGEKGLVLTFC